MNVNIYSIGDPASFDVEKLKPQDILISNQTKCDFSRIKEIGKTISYSNSLGNFPNSILEILDHLLSLYKEEDNYHLIILGGNYIINQYLVLFIYLIKGDICYKDIDLPILFDLRVDDEEILIFKNRLKKVLSPKEFSLLPHNWRSIYYQKEKGYELSKFGEFLIDNQSGER